MEYTDMALARHPSIDHGALGGIEHGAGVAEARGKSADAERQTHGQSLALVFENLARGAIAQFAGQTLERGLIARLTEQGEAGVAIARGQILALDVRGDEGTHLIQQCIEDGQTDALADLTGGVNFHVHQATAVLRWILARQLGVELIEYM